MAKKRPSDEQLKKLLSHVDYEVKQLLNTYAVLSRFVFEPDDPYGKTIAYALIESFCIHARGLHEFLTDGKYTQASWFVDKPYEPGGVEMDLVKKLHTQIAHLTHARADDPSGNIGTEDRKAMRRQLLHRLKLFEVALNDKWRPLWEPLGGMLDLSKTGPEATNTVQLISNS